MGFYMLLGAATIIIVYLSVLIWLKSRTIGFLVGISFFYYWSLYGAWSIINDGLGGDSGKHYQYLFERLFVVYLDQYYLEALALYAGFIILVQLTVLIRVRPAMPDVWAARTARLKLDHGRVLLLSGSALVVSAIIISNALALASTLGLSGYFVSRGGANAVSEYFTLHQVLNRVAIIPTALGLAVMLSGDDPRFVCGSRNNLFLRAYMALLLAIFVFCIVLGNKNELFFGLVSGSIFYLANARKPRWGKFVALGVAAFAGIAWIDFMRGISIDQLINNISLADVVMSAREVALSSNEAYAAHMSMYGALYYEIPLTYGSSLLSLAASIIPRILWRSRPDTIYEHYASHVNAYAGQGYSIHHVTGWYLNFGVFGVVLGAICLGLVWAKLYNNYCQASRSPRSHLSELFCVLAFSTFTANLPSLVRAGPEAYKGVVVDAFLIPIFCLYISSRMLPASPKNSTKPGLPPGSLA